MDLGLRNKVAIITGGASNIGRQVVLTMAEEKANIAIFDLDPDAAQRVADLAPDNGEGSRIRVFQTDIAEPSEVERSVEQVIDEFGRIDVLTNIVGWAKDESFLDESRTKQEKLMNVNFWGALNMVHSTIPHMIEQGYGRIVLVASDAARIGEFKEAVYSAAKAATIALSKALAREFGKHDITLNSVCPALTPPVDASTISRQSFWHENLAYWTPERQERAKRFYPLRRVGRPEDTANMVVFLASDRASFVTGQTISVSGGYTML